MVRAGRLVHVFLVGLFPLESVSTGLNRDVADISSNSAANRHYMLRLNSLRLLRSFYLFELGILLWYGTLAHSNITGTQAGAEQCTNDSWHSCRVK